AATASGAARVRPSRLSLDSPLSSGRPPGSRGLHRRLLRSRYLSEHGDRLPRATSETDGVLIDLARVDIARKASTAPTSLDHWARPHQPIGWVTRTWFRHSAAPSRTRSSVPMTTIFGNIHTYLMRAPGPLRMDQRSKKEASFRGCRSKG